MSDYVPTDWVDNVTPVDAARMDHLEAGVDVNRDAVIDHETRIDSIEAGKENKSEKGAVNGYAPLGADTKVPSIYLPAGGGGGGVDYDGAWAAGTPYIAGDVVLYNGVEYLAVNPSTGQTPPAVVPASPASIIPLVTALPSSPFDGQEVDFTDSLLTPSYVWRFRYVAAAPSSKWKFVGGSPMSSGVANTDATAGTTFVDLTNPGPSLTVPVTGIYDVTVSCLIYSAAVNATGFMAPKLGAAATQYVDGGMTHTESNNSGLYGTRRLTIPAATVVKVQYRTDNGAGGGASVSFLERWLRIIPVAVG